MYQPTRQGPKAAEAEMEAPTLNNGPDIVVEYTESGGGCRSTTSSSMLWLGALALMMWRRRKSRLETHLT